MGYGHKAFIHSVYSVCMILARAFRSRDIRDFVVEATLFSTKLGDAGSPGDEGGDSPAGGSGGGAGGIL